MFGFCFDVQTVHSDLNQKQKLKHNLELKFKTHN